MGYANIIQLDRSVCPFCRILSKFYFCEVKNFLKINIFYRNFEAESLKFEHFYDKKFLKNTNFFDL